LVWAGRIDKEHPTEIALTQDLVNVPDGKIRQKNQPQQQGRREDLEPCAPGDGAHRFENGAALDEAGDGLLYDQEYDQKDDEDDGFVQNTIDKRPLSIPLAEIGRVPDQHEFSEDQRPDGGTP
jgi:hypothetical protein